MPSEFLNISIDGWDKEDVNSLIELLESFAESDKAPEEIFSLITE